MIAARRAGLMLALAALAGCETLPERPPEQRTTVVAAPTPIAVPCFTEDQRPKFPTPTPVDVATATTEQLAAAELADAIAMRDYAEAVDRLFLQCRTKGPAP